MKIEMKPVELLRLIVRSIEMDKLDNAKGIAQDAIKQLETLERIAKEDASSPPASAGDEREN